jgi:hypothetical protein
LNDQDIWQVVIKDKTDEEHMLSFNADTGVLLSSAALDLLCMSS